MVHSNVDEPQEHYDEGRKLHMKEYMLYDSIYMKLKQLAKQIHGFRRWSDG